MIVREPSDLFLSKFVHSSIEVHIYNSNRMHVARYLVTLMVLTGDEIHYYINTKKKVNPSCVKN